MMDYDAKILDFKNKVSNHDHDKYITTSEIICWQQKILLQD